MSSPLKRINTLQAGVFIYLPTGILLMFVRATRQVDWELHLSAFRRMLPWFYACDKVNYARYGTAYWLEMKSLETTHPGLLLYTKMSLPCFCKKNYNHVSAILTGILSELSSNFSVQRQNNHGFAAVSCDQTIEQTVNRDSKTKGGLVGFSMNRTSVHRWLLSQAERAAVTQRCKSMSGMNNKSRYVI